MFNPVVYLMGDFNFVDSQIDTTSNFTATQRPMHDKLLHDLNLREISQPCHTYYFKSQDPSVIPRSARLDRIYSNLTEADLVVAAPLAYLPTNPIAGKDKFNEHLPIAAIFAGPSKSKSSFRLPESTVLNPSFKKTFKGLWEQTNKEGLGPLEKMNMFKKVLRKTHFSIRATNGRNALGLFVAAVRLLTVLSQPNPVPERYREILLTYPNLGSYISKTNNEWNLVSLREYVNHRFSVDGEPMKTDADTSTISGDREILDNISSLPPRSKDNNILSNIKLTLPSSQFTIKMLRPHPNADPSDDPDILGGVIQKHYGALWNDDSTNNEDCISDYLDDYDKRIDLNLFKDLSLELIARAVASAPNSSRGPDGIPFSAYKKLSDIANPLLLDCARALQGSELSLSDFNRARLTLLPKNSTLLVDDTRPICVNNTDNRIIAKALVYCASDAAQALIGDYQKMFLPGRQMMDHLFSLNEEYYGSWREQKQRYVLFTDNKKAFDSIQHSYIFAVLRKLGFPPWFINTVRSLLTDASTFSGLSPSYDVPFRRGVKQGCPLSPLLFLLIYDPLIYKLQKTQVTVRAAADDLALSSQSLGPLIGCFARIDKFTAASGMGINVSKTKILSTIDHPCPYEAAHSARISCDAAAAAATAAAGSLAAAIAACSSFEALLPVISTPPSQPDQALTNSPADQGHLIVNSHIHMAPPSNGFSISRCLSPTPNHTISSLSSPVSPSSSLLLRNRKKPRRVFSRPKRKRNNILPDSPDAPLPPPPPSPIISPHTLLRNSRWPEVKIAKQYIYLGVPIGATYTWCVTPEMIYDKAMDKIRKKFILLKPALNQMSVQRRIITINVFILSLLSYVNQLVRMPDTVYSELRRLIHKHTTPWNGTSWGYNLLVVPCASGGFPTPINDPWVTNVLALLRRVKWDDVNINSIPWEPNSVDHQDIRSSGIWEGSVRCSDNINLAIVDFLGPLYYNWDKVSSLNNLSRSVIKHSLIKNGFICYPSTNKLELTNNWGRDYNDYLSIRLGHFGVSSYCGELKEHYKKPVKNSYLFENHLKIITNSLATARRRRVIQGVGSVLNPLPTCRLCNQADDGVMHLFFNCLIVKEAMALVAHHNLIDVSNDIRDALVQNPRPLFLPVSPSFSAPNFNPLLHCMAFCRAVTDATNRIVLGIDINPAASFIMNTTLKYLRPALLKPLSTLETRARELPSKRNWLMIMLMV